MNIVKQRNFKKRMQGLVTILLVIAVPFLVVALGYAIDTGRAYLVKAKLNAAVDAAAIAAARAVSQGEDAAIAAGNKFFAANMPDGLYGSTPTPPSYAFSIIPEGEDNEGSFSISLTASATLSWSFFHSLDLANFTVQASGQVIRRPLDMALVVDNTTSLRLGSAGDVTGDVKDRSIEFISHFNESFDRVVLVNYAFGAQTPVPFRSDRSFSKSEINSAINDFSFGSLFNAQYTNASEGFYRALDAMRSVNEPASLQVIVFFTDGAPNTFASKFDIRSTSTDYVGAISAIDGFWGGGHADGLWRVDRIATEVSGTANRGSNIDNYIESIPIYYTAHADDATEFAIYNPDHPTRPVGQYSWDEDSASDLYNLVHRVSRNLVEDMANKARQEGIYVFTLGLGSSLTTSEGPDDDIGQDLLLRMANDPKMLNDVDLADEYEIDQPHGVYCHAVDGAALGPCFDKMLDVIIRLTQ